MLAIGRRATGGFGFGSANHVPSRYRVAQGALIATFQKTLANFLDLFVHHKSINFGVQLHTNGGFAEPSALLTLS